MPSTATEKSTSPSLLGRLVALMVLLVAGFILFKVVWGFLSGIFFLLVIVAALAAVYWAYSTLKR